jgi:hypothetical protein
MPSSSPTLRAPPPEFDNPCEGSKWELVDSNSGSPLSSPRKLEARNKALKAYWETFEHVNGNHDDPALKTAFRWLRIFCGHCTVYRDSQVAHNNSARTTWVHPAHAVEVYKCRLCGATCPVGHINSDFKGLAGVGQ